MKESSEKENGAGIFKQSMGARNRVGIRYSYRPTMQATQPDGIVFLGIDSWDP